MEDDLTQFAMPSTRRLSAGVRGWVQVNGSHSSSHGCHNHIWFDLESACPVFNVSKCNAIWLIRPAETFYVSIHTQWGRVKMADILQTKFSRAFSWMKIVVLYVKFHEICPQWSSQQLRHYPNQRWSSFMTYIYATGSQSVKLITSTIPSPLDERKIIRIKVFKCVCTENITT